MQENDTGFPESGLKRGAKEDNVNKKDINKIIFVIAFKKGTHLICGTILLRALPRFVDHLS